ncbi:MAG: VWA domain-containing protein [Promethearchaeota archaeon]
MVKEEPEFDMERNSPTGDFMENRVLQWTPISFSAEFIRRMRKEKARLMHVPSTRQAVAVPGFLTARYYRIHKLLPEDFIDAAKLTTPIEDQKIAAKVAFDILFPNAALNVPAKSRGSGNASAANLVGDRDESGGDFIDDLLSEMMEAGIDVENLDRDGGLEETLNNLDKIIDFINHMYQGVEEGDQQSRAMSSILEGRGGFNNLMTKGIDSMPTALDFLQQIIQSEVNTLSPSDVRAAVDLGWANQVIEQAKTPWVNLASRFLAGEGGFNQSLNKIMEGDDVGTAAKSLRYLSDVGMNEKKMGHMVNDLVSRARNLSDILEISLTLGYVPRLLPNNLLQESLERGVSQAFNAAREIDKKFGTQMANKLFAEWKELNRKPTIYDMFESQVDHHEWRQMLRDAVSREINGCTSPEQACNELTRLAMQIAEMSKLAQFETCKRAFMQEAVTAGTEALNRSASIPEFLATLKQQFDAGVKFSGDDAVSIGSTKGISEDTILEIFGGNYELLKTLFEKKIGNFDRYFEMMQNIAGISREQVAELMEIALETGNMQGLGALGHFNLGNTSQVAAEKGDYALEMMEGGLTVGPGDNLVKQWFMHRHSIPAKIKDFIRKLTKEALVKIAMDNISNQRGSGEKGLVPMNQLRVFIDGDEMDLVDIDATVENIIMAGKSIDMILTEDLLVQTTKKGRVSICFLLDISGSMGGQKLAACSIAVLSLIGQLNVEEVAICFFESNTHIVKEFGDERKIEDVSDELLDLKASGGTQVQAALNWGAHQLDECKGEVKICFILTDCMFSESDATIEKEFEKYMNAHAKVILGVNTAHYNDHTAQVILDTTKGELVKILNIPDIPKVITEVLDKIG